MVLAEMSGLRLLLWVMFLVAIPAAAVWAKVRDRAVRERLARIEEKLDRLLGQQGSPK